MQPIFKTLIVGTATALLAAGCASTGTTSSGAAGATSADTTSSPAASIPPTEGRVIATSSAADSSAPPSAVGKTTVYGCDHQPASQPKTYILTCGDGGVVLDRLAWSGWGTAKTTATGVQTQNSCLPSCAAGSPVSTKATVTLSALNSGHYTKLHVVTAKETTDYTIDASGPLPAG